MVIKRKNTMVKNENGVTNNTLPKSRKLGYGGYMLPQYDNVPAGDYYSRITNVERITSKGKPGISVCYKMIKFEDGYQKANNIYKSNQDPTIYKIRQIYPFDSQAYDRFLEAMYEDLNLIIKKISI